MNNNVYKDKSDKGKLMTILQTAIITIVPILIVFEILACTSEYVIGLINPNPGLSAFAEKYFPALLLCTANYILLAIYSQLRRLSLSSGKSIKCKYIKAAAVLYTFVNTFLFVYYFYMNFIYETSMWHWF